MSKQQSKTKPQNRPQAQAPQVKKRYWFGNIHIQGVGIVNGAVREDHLAKFKAQHKRGCAMNGLPDIDQKPLNLDYYIRDTDILGDQKTKNEQARRKKLGY